MNLKIKHDVELDIDIPTKTVITAVLTVFISAIIITASICAVIQF